MNYEFARNLLIAAVIACPVGAVAYVMIDTGPEIEAVTAATSTTTSEPAGALAFADEELDQTTEAAEAAKDVGATETTDEETSSSSSTTASTSTTTTTSTAATVAPTTAAPTTTTAPTTAVPTTAAPTTTTASTTAAPRPTTASTTAAPRPTTTASPTTAVPTTAVPTTTTAPTTAAPTTAAPTTTAPTGNQQQAAAVSLAELNATRAQVGLAPLIVDAAMSTFATNWSIEMISSGFRHSSGPYAENIAWHSNGNMTPQNAAQYFNQAWVDSPGHYANMTNASYTHVGIGLVKDGSGWWATHVFR